MLDPHDCRNVIKTIDDLIEAQGLDLENIREQIGRTYSGDMLAFAFLQLEKRIQKLPDSKKPDSPPRIWTRVYADEETAKFEILKELQTHRPNKGYFQVKYLHFEKLLFLKYIETTDDVSRRVHLAKILKEFRAYNVLRDPNIVEVYDAGWVKTDTDQQYPFIVTAYLEAGNLQEWVMQQTGSIHARKVGEIAFVIASTLQRLLSADKTTVRFIFGDSAKAEVMHLDLKPDNVMVLNDQSGKPGNPSSESIRLIDFGSAGVAETADADCGESYRAPERAASMEPDPSWDVYAIGAIMYFLRYKRHPQPSRCGKTEWEVFTSTIDLEDSDLTLICQKCLAYDSDSRYQSAGELSRDLDAWLRDRPLPIVRKGTYAWLDRFKLLRKRCHEQNDSTDHLQMASYGSTAAGIGISFGFVAQVALALTGLQTSTSVSIIGNSLSVVVLFVMFFFMITVRFRPDAMRLCVPIFVYIPVIILIAARFVPNDFQQMPEQMMTVAQVKYCLLVLGLGYNFYIYFSSLPWRFGLVGWTAILLAEILHEGQASTIGQLCAPSTLWGMEAVCLFAFGAIANWQVRQGGEV